MNPAVPDIPGYVDVVFLERGGFGAVYTAVHEHIGWNVAIKVLDQVLSSDPTARDRFRRETRLMGTLDGVPHIVAIKHADLVPASGAPYLVMRLMEGGSLAALLRRRGTLTSGEVAKIGIDIAGALASARSHNIIHRDVKPANILLDAAGESHIADFGIAVTAGAQVTADTRAQMSIEHAPPERLDGRSSLPGTHAGDVYSLGSTLLTLLLGAPPFGAAEVGIGELARRILDEPPPSPRPGAASPGLVAVVHAAMAKDPDARPSAASLASQLQSVARDERLTLAPISFDTAAATPLSPGPASSAWESGGAPTSSPAWVQAPPPFAGPAAFPGANDAPTVARPLAAPEVDVDPGPTPGWRRPGVIAAVVAAVVVLLALLVAVASGGDDPGGDGAGPTTTAGGGGAVLRIEPPVVESVSVENGLQFTWSDPNERTTDPDVRAAYADGGLNYLYVVTVDGASGDPTEFQRDDVGGYRTTQRVDEVTVAGSAQPVDVTAHAYCIEMWIFSERIVGENPWVASEPTCE